MIRRGDVYLADLSPVQGSEQGGESGPVAIKMTLVINIGPTVIVAAITGRINKAKIPDTCRD